MNTLVSTPGEGHQFWLSYARHMLKCADEAIKRGIPLRGALRVPPPISGYGAKTIWDIRHRMAGKPCQRKRDLLREAKKFEQHKDWRGNIPTLADYFAKALYALANEVKRGKAGSRSRRFGVSAIPARRIVNEVYEELTFLTLRTQGMEAAAELYEGGKPNRSSPGVDRVVHAAMDRACQAGQSLSRAEVLAQIREYRKIRKPNGYNYLSFFICRNPRKGKQKRRLIPAPGTEK